MDDLSWVSDRLHMDTIGCTYTEYSRIVGRELASIVRLYHGKHPAARYTSHRSGAKRKGIGFELSFAEWWGIWQQSGKYPKMGVRRDQYVMARNGDVGPYAVGNVRICLSGENVREGFVNRRERKAAAVAPATAQE